MMGIRMTQTTWKVGKFQHIMTPSGFRSRVANVWQPVIRLTNKSQYIPLCLVIFTPPPYQTGDPGSTGWLSWWFGLALMKTNIATLYLVRRWRALLRLALHDDHPHIHKDKSSGGWLHLWANKEIVDENEILMSQRFDGHSIIHTCHSYNYENVHF